MIYHDVAEGRHHIDFSDWDRPDHQHVDEFQKVFENHSMPPAGYLLLHPSARLSPADMQTLQQGLIQLAGTYGH